MTDKKEFLQNSVQIAKEEDLMLEAIDTHRTLVDALPILQNLKARRISVKKAIELAGPLLTQELFKLAFGAGTSQKVRADVVKHMLAITGVQPAQKVEITKVDADMPRESIMAVIRGTAKSVKDSGIEIVEDIEVESQNTDKES